MAQRQDQNLKQNLECHAMRVIQKKLDKLQSRRWVLFPWLWTARLLKLYKQAKDALK